MIANALGAGPVADAFYAAFRFLTSSAACSPRAPSIPPSSPLRPPWKERARRRLGKFAEDVLAALLVVLMALTAVVMIATPLVVTLIAPGFAANPEKFDLTVELFRIMFPYLICMSLTAMVTGVLNAYRKFFVAAIAPLLLNVTAVSALMLGRRLHSIPSRSGGFFRGRFPSPALRSFSGW